jgi:hypothetical protein
MLGRRTILSFREVLAKFVAAPSEDLIVESKLRIRCAANLTKKLK